jgi:hypothetical protein
MTFLLGVRVAELEDMSKLAIAWRMSTLYYARFHQAERSFKPCLTAPSVFHLALPPLSSFSGCLPAAFFCLLWTLPSAGLAQASAYLHMAEVCRLTILHIGLTGSRLFRKFFV